jgi:hypothetical protein
MELSHNVHDANFWGKNYDFNWREKAPLSFPSP